MTATYHCGQPAISLCPLDLGLGWRHTIIDEPNFVSPWEASSKALELSFQLGTLTCQGTGHNPPVPAPRTRILRDDAMRPRFCDLVEVFIGHDDSWSMSSCTLTHDDLCHSHAKPWGWYFSNDTWDYDADDDCYHPRRLNRSCREPFCDSNVSISRSPQCIMLRTNDAWHNPLPQEAIGDGEEPDPDVIPDHTHAPQFVQDLMELASRYNAFDEMDEIDELGVLRIRTWYLHHRDHQRNVHPRILEFEEDWRRWEFDIGSAWRDFIQPNQAIQIHVISPDPYKGYMSRPTHADVVISQGHWLPRFSSVITVHKNSRTHAPHSFAVASSLERRVSGVKLATEADVLHLCNHPGTRCSITFRWHVIPFSLRPVHEVTAGQSFVIQIVDANPSLGNEARPSCAPQATQSTSGVHDADVDYDMPEVPDDAHVSRAPSDHTPSGSSIHSDDLSLLIYRLEAPDAHCFTQGDNYAAILSSAIRACRLPRRLVRCFHYLTVCPIGVDPDHETAIILHTITDIAAGSAEKLILVDTEIHFHPLRGGLVVPAAHSRRVMKVNPHLHRNQLLILTGLLDYCELQEDRCTVFCNHEVWASQDRRVKDVSHGHYFRIVVPPPRDEHLDTELAIAIARDLDVDVGTDQVAVPSCTPGLSMRQTAARSCTSHGPTSCKTDPDGDYAWDAPQAPQRRVANHFTAGSTPHGFFGPGVRRHLEAALERDDLIECEEEGSILYLHTWFIHHRIAPRCYDGRALRLLNDPSTWIEDIKDLWIDRIQPDEPFQVKIVHPRPPCSRFECVQAHLILEQAATPHFVTGLVSLPLHRDETEFWTHRALSLQHLQNHRSLLEAAELTLFCSTLRCSFSHNDIPIGTADIDEIGDAWNFVLTFLPDLGAALDDHDDLSSLMQKKLHPGDIDPGVPGPTGECAALERPSSLNPNAPVFVPSQDDIRHQPDDVQALFEVWRYDASAWEQESPAAHFLVWFLCPPHGHQRCLYARRVTLFDDFTQWRERLIFAWRDLVIPHVPVAIHVVQPHPEPLEHDITAHIILTQLMPDHGSGVLINIADDAVNDALPFRLAITLNDPSQLSEVLTSTAYTTEVGVFTLMRIGETLAPNQLFPTRHGYGYTLRVVRPFLQPGWNPPVLPAVPGAEGLGLIQTKLTLLRTATCERLTHGQVAHTHGPQDVSTLDEEDSCEASCRNELSLSDHITKIVDLMPGTDMTALPPFVEVPISATERDIEETIGQYGCHCHAFVFGNHDRALCVPLGWDDTQTKQHVMFANEDTSDPFGAFVHSFDTGWTEIHLMRILYKLGYEKALILRTQVRTRHLTYVSFSVSYGSLAPSKRNRPQKPWPARQPQVPRAKLFEGSDQIDTPCLLRWNLDHDDLKHFFQSNAATLRRSLEGVQVPQVTTDALDGTTQFSNFDDVDRLIVYVDGSSQPTQRHLPPMQVDLEGIPDAWAFLVLGETYHAHGGSTFSLVGWASQQVRYDPSSHYFVGATRVGPHIAEREGLFFAALWRAQLNLNIPTVFRSDSSLAIGQATGAVGAIDIDLSFSLLRGLFQFLELALGTESLCLEHIYGHNDDP